MSLSTYMERLKYVDDLIRRKATGDLSSLARKLKLSKGHTVIFINEMREQGFPIEYSRKLKSYFYSEDGNVTRNLFEKKKSTIENKPIELSANQLRKISGGATFFNIPFHADYI